MTHAASLLPLALLLAAAGCLEGCGTPGPVSASLINDTQAAVEVAVEVRRGGENLARLERSLPPGGSAEVPLDLGEGAYEATVTVAGHPPATQAFDVTCAGGGFAVAVTSAGVHTAESVVD